ncbi:MAG: glucose-1-phosphate cytidylyltransferase [Candidatus Nanoarchaeia archaeon]|nr:glucose-1-phosphate cytidylyltransferase [Candidatus Nanoarchaeia archaeon]MDD5239274.1 glucose-1-phosphate cytidylyltransferase [Candidatus Nanoarchaeia archaeon]
MKCVILCGGKGTRMKEETEFKPKPLVRLDKMPILWHIMKIYSHYGVKDFILCLGYKGEMIKDYFLNYRELNSNFTLDLSSGKEKMVTTHCDPKSMDDWKITFVDTGEENMTGSRIAQIKEYIGNDEDFFLTYGDGLSDVNINELYKFHKSKGRIATLIAVQPYSYFGVLNLENGLVKSFQEKPRLDGTINGGFFVCNRKIFDYLDKDSSCVFEQEPLKNLARDKELAAFSHNGFWFAMDTYKHVETLNKMLDSGNAPWLVWRTCKK